MFRSLVHSLATKRWETEFTRLAAITTVAAFPELCAHGEPHSFTSFTSQDIYSDANEAWE